MSLPPTDSIREACGVAAVFVTGERAADLLYWALTALQHRGQDSAGMAVGRDGRIARTRGLGLVSQAFAAQSLRRLEGHIGIGHVRYSTSGSISLANAQPVLARTPAGPVALAHNGHLLDHVRLHRQLGGEPGDGGLSSDTRLIAALIGAAAAEDCRSALLATLPLLRGAYSLVATDGRRIFAARDPRGFRPLCLGRLGGRGWLVVSESCAFDTLGAQLVREVDPGELLTIGPGGVDSVRFAEARPSGCVFEFVYFSRADSVLAGTSVFQARYRMGAALAREAPAEADVVVPVPDSGIPAALGYAHTARLEYANALVRNNYAGRTFILPTQRRRREAVRIKFALLRGLAAGKRVVVIDDSVVRAHTITHVIDLLRDAGAVAVHVRVASPPVRWPCFYGIDMPTRGELAAAEFDVDALGRLVGTDSLEYLSLEAMLESVEGAAGTLCTACFSGQYPLRVRRGHENAGVRELTHRR